MRNLKLSESRIDDYTGELNRINREIDELKHEHIVLRESNLKARTLLSSLRKKNINSKRLLKIINQN